MNPVMKIDKDGTKLWYLNGELHRTDGPAMLMTNGYARWLINGLYHRVNGPAIIGDNEEWCLHGELHREDGPAVRWEDGTEEWWINGNKLSEPEIEILKAVT